MEDGLSRQALAAARALAQAGWTVGVGEQLRRGITASSRAVTYRHHAPAPNEDPRGFIDAVKDAVDRVGYEVVFGARDVDVLCLSHHRDEIGAVIPYPAHEHLVGVMDKEKLYAAAQSVGIATPKTEPATPKRIDSWPVPTMVKARLHASADGTASRLPRLETRPARTRDELRAIASEMQAAGGEPLLQERISGRLLELSVLCGPDGQLLAHVLQEADAVWPVGAGVAVRARTVPMDEALLERSAALTRERRWYGIAELQFLVPPEGEPHLIDFNGRFYGSLALAVAAGVNAPAMWAAMATQRPLPPTPIPTIGRRYQWFLADFRRSLDGGARGRLKRAIGTFAYARGAAQSVFSVRDPLPAARYMTIIGTDRFF